MARAEWGSVQSIVIDETFELTDPFFFPDRCALTASVAPQFFDSGCGNKTSVTSKALAFAAVILEAGIMSLWMAPLAAVD